MDFIDDENVYKVTKKDIDRVRPLSISKLLSASGFILFMCTIFNTFLVEREPLFISVGLVLYLILLFFTLVLVDCASIFKIKILNTPNWFNNYVANLGILSLIIIIILYFI